MCFLPLILISNILLIVTFIGYALLFVTTSSLWLADWLYGMIFRTHRLDVVEFVPLPENDGVQMLWKNPRGFETKSGEFVRVRVPWLDKGGEQWHPFSIYLKEATKEGLDEVHRQERLETGRIFVGEESKGGRPIKLNTTAILLVEFQVSFLCSIANAFRCRTHS